MTNSTNFDVDELHKFNRDYKAWWDPQGDFCTLHHINPARLDFINQQINLAGLHILDVGCGGGILSESMAALGAHVTGLDLASEAILVAKEHAKTNNLSSQYYESSIEDWAEMHPAQYDVVTCMELLEHVPDPSLIVEACKNAVKPGGIIIFSTLNRTFKAYLFAVLGAEYILKLLPKKTHDYAKFIKPSELSSWCRKVDLTVLQLQGLDYNPFQKTAKITSQLDINYMLVCQRESASQGS